MTLDFGVVRDIREIMGHEAAERVVIGVNVRGEEFGEEVGFLVGSGAKLVAVGRIGEGAILDVGAGVHAIVLAVF